MSIITWDHFTKENKRLHDALGNDSTIALDYKDGFFICPDDYDNERSGLPKIIFRDTIVDLFKRKHNDIYYAVDTFYRLLGGFDHRDYQKFKDGAKLAYLFAAAQHVLDKTLQLKKPNELYSEPHHSDITRNLQVYLPKFLESAAKAGVRIAIIPLFAFATSILQRAIPPGKMPADFQGTNTFLRARNKEGNIDDNPNYNPYSNLIGASFEEETELEFTQRRNDAELENAIHAKTGERGVLLPLDQDKEFKELANKRANGIGLPDYIFVTERHIYPIDIKVNLHYAKMRQVSADNLRTLFERCAAKANIILDGCIVEGTLIHAP